MISESHEELIQQLGNALLDTVGDEGWRRIDVFSAMNPSVHDLRFTVIMNDGSRPRTAPPPVLDEILQRLRQVMYEPGRGTWFSARISMDPPASIYYSYNFDYEPHLAPRMSARGYAEDLVVFPRDPEHVPAWLSRKLATVTNAVTNGETR